MLIARGNKVGIYFFFRSIPIASPVKQCAPIYRTFFSPSYIIIFKRPMFSCVSIRTPIIIIIIIVIMSSSSPPRFVPRTFTSRLLSRRATPSASCRHLSCNKSLSRSAIEPRLKYLPHIPVRRLTVIYLGVRRVITIFTQCRVCCFFHMFLLLLLY